MAYTHTFGSPAPKEGQSAAGGIMRLDVFILALALLAALLAAEAQPPGKNVRTDRLVLA